MSLLLDECDYSCVVCLDHLIGPYSIGCGHTVCAQCFSLLREKKCPLCRFKFSDGDKYGINIVLDKILSTIVPDYSNRRAQHDKFVQSITIIRTYRKSARYHWINKAIKKYLAENKNCCVLSDLTTQIINDCQSAYDIVGATYDEVCYQLDRLHCIRLEVEGRNLVLYMDNDDDGDHSILNKLRTLVPNPIDKGLLLDVLYYLYGIFELEDLGLKPVNRKFLEDHTNMISLLLTLSLPADTNSDGDSDDSDI